MTWVLLLRGINVGGAHVVKMARLKEVLESFGFRDVKTYLNSGNVVFASDTIPDAKELREKLEDEFGFELPSLLVSGDDIVRIADAIPAEWSNDYDFKNGQKSDVAYLFSDVDNSEILEKIGQHPEFETLIYIKGAVLSNVSHANQPRSSLLKVVGTKLYQNMTVRNVTTARKLADMAREMERT
jgi:uncharacterized protein (DUF1697 family)